MTWQALQEAFRSAPLHALLHRDPGIELRLADIDRLHRPLATALLLTLTSRSPRRLLGDDGSTRAIKAHHLPGYALREVHDRIATPKLIKTVSKDLDAIDKRFINQAPGSFRRDRSAIYLRTDLVFGLTSGGSVGHVAGVVNQLAQQLPGVLMLTTDTMPGVSPDIAQQLLDPGQAHWGQAERIALSANTAYGAALMASINKLGAGMIYQRYSLNNYAGLRLAAQTGLPLVIEFNGSEPWIARQWSGRPLRYEPIAQRIESMNLKHADLVVVVSEPMRQTVIDLGAPPERVLVNPNGVDTDVYRPDVDARHVAEEYKLKGKTVIGFIGTFDQWHGAPVMIEAIAKLLMRRPELGETLAVLMIGDGPQHAECERLVTTHRLSHIVKLIGRIHQADGPAHLAACDFLASPHVPNDDGSAFFGSPTKLFEYMAMGRAIVASSLGQIAEVLDHEDTALLTRPGDAQSLSSALECLIDNADLRKRLARAARERALSHHTWATHVERILGQLEDPAGPLG